ncbi:protein TonB [Duganella sacchari]|uniref:Protein TonB n=1 Tax=Duganella sacchari TaxID=551987 RepID=A0A1M7N6K6_9BURK|nr:TonB C-terminal domain-containing protein [Duganella sacchari]SHM98707.1 protein TonB [Duganella sacchari]
MRDTMPFLARLGLDTETDARAIRRAYARELKLIDQEQDGAAFQELREAYESALSWLAWRDQQATDSAAAPAPLTPEPVAPDYGMPRTPVSLGIQPEAAAEPQQIAHEDPQRLAAAVLEDFRAAMQQLLQDHHVRNPVPWQQALQHSLDDERLLNISARIYFEAHIAQQLVSGWRPGHDLLFSVACKIFQWSEDRRRLLQLGRAGALIDKAIEEHTIFAHLPEADLMINRAVLDLLRKDGTPSDYQLRNDLPYAERMAAYFPVWMSVVTNTGMVAQWRARFDALPPPKKSWWPKININLSSRAGWILFLMLLQLVRVAYNYSSERADTTPAPRFPQLQQAAPPVVQQLPPEMLQKIKAHMPTESMDLGPGQHRADINVVLDDKGSIYQIMVYQTSGRVSYDSAAISAIRACAPFPAAIPREFLISFNVRDNATP